MKFLDNLKAIREIPIPRIITKTLTWLVIGFGLFCIVLGAVVRDDVPVFAQSPAETTTPESAANVAPTAAPTAASAPTAEPTAASAPTAAPTAASAPTAEPTAASAPIAAPTAASAPIAEPTAASAPIAEPTAASAPIAAPTAASAPIAEPTAAPAPTTEPTAAPAPATEPTAAAAPTAELTAKPSANAEPAPQAAKTPQSQSKKDIIQQKKNADNTSIFSRIMSVVGIFAFIGIGYLLSNNRKKILWRLVFVGTAIQFVFALFILKTSIGEAIFAFLNDAVSVLLDFTTAGTTFLFASFASGTIEQPLLNTAMSILPPIIFFSSLMTVLYHLGVMQWIVKGMASFMMKIMGTSGSESLSSVANIFVGMTEAPLVVKPYVANMTKSELFAVMSGGMATVAGGVMASYVAMLQPFFPDIAGHLIAASVMSAPASLVVAKLMIPETEESETMGKAKLDMPKTDANAIDAAARGAGEGLQLALNVGAMLLAFIAIIALINFLLGLPSRLVNANTYDHVSAFVVQEGGSLDPACEKIYSSSDTIACTHNALLQLSQLRGLEIPESLKTLSGEQSQQIDTTESLYQTVIAAAPAQPDAPALEQKSLWPLLSLEVILGWLFFPIAFLMGVPLSDCFLVAQLIGEKTAVNEFVAYLHLSRVVDVLSYRSIVIATYALCGFANFGSIAIQIGGIGGMAPNRRHDIAKLGIKAMIAGSIAAFMTATIAGALI